ncbi:YTH domain-containing protein ECT3-like [Phoenix dactylifera]|uniref:YTH domain-containing family protein n=1 Tax=Phoenix dactylifera TaxID=42345 RepID=A0A8B8IZF3_PHODC|nr:YTH domain-containing protein ECT3-like [Phoenix dactylifera]
MLTTVSLQVKLEEGLRMLEVFKDHTSKTSILDGFTFYEIRQKVMQERKAKQQQLQKKAVDGLPGDVENSKDGTNWKPRLQKPLVTVLEKGPVQGELKPSEESEAPAVSGVNPKDATPVTEEQVSKSSIAVGC